MKFLREQLDIFPDKPIEIPGGGTAQVEVPPILAKERCPGTVVIRDRDGKEVARIPCEVRRTVKEISRPGDS
jgi:hypothetical protein